MNGRQTTWRVLSAVGAVIGYGCLAAFLGLIGAQVYRWFQEGEWTHVSVADGLRRVLDHLHLSADGSGRLERLSHWLDTPVDWLGLHKVIEVLPASLALFAVAVFGNFIFVYGSDRLRDSRRAG